MVNKLGHLDYIAGGNRLHSKVEKKPCRIAGWETGYVTSGTVDNICMRD